MASQRPIYESCYTTLALKQKRQICNEVELFLCSKDLSSSSSHELNKTLQGVCKMSLALVWTNDIYIH